MNCIECLHDNVNREHDVIIQINDKRFPLCNWHAKNVRVVCMMKGVKFKEVDEIEEKGTKALA